MVVVPKALFYASYGADNADVGVSIFHAATHYAELPAPWRRWTGDCARQSADLTQALRRTVDFKVQSDRDAIATSDRPRVLLAQVVGTP